VALAAQQARRGPQQQLARVELVSAQREPTADGPQAHVSRVHGLQVRWPRAPRVSRELGAAQAA